MGFIPISVEFHHKMQTYPNNAYIVELHKKLAKHQFALSYFQNFLLSDHRLATFESQVSFYSSTHLSAYNARVRIRITITHIYRNHSPPLIFHTQTVDIVACATVHRQCVVFISVLCVFLFLSFRPLAGDEYARSSRALVSNKRPAPARKHTKTVLYMRNTATFARKHHIFLRKTVEKCLRRINSKYRLNCIATGHARMHIIGSRNATLSASAYSYAFCWRTHTHTLTHTMAHRKILIAICAILLQFSLSSLASARADKTFFFL